MVGWFHNHSVYGSGLVRTYYGAQIAMVEEEAAPTFSMCSSNTDYVSATLRYNDLRPGNRYCVLTDSGRRSLITVKRLPRDGDRTAIHLQVRTWSEKRPTDDTNYLPWILLGIFLLAIAGGGAKSASSKD